jgi:hypothetical protein
MVRRLHRESLAVVAPSLGRVLAFCGTTSGCEQTFTAAMCAVNSRQFPGEVLEWAYWKVKIDFRFR